MIRADRRTLSRDVARSRADLLIGSGTGSGRAARRTARLDFGQMRREARVVVSESARNARSRRRVATVLSPQFGLRSVP